MNHMEDEAMNKEISEIFEEEDINLESETKEALKERYAAVTAQLENLKAKFADLEDQVKGKCKETAEKVKTKVQETKEKVGDPYLKTSCDYRLDVYRNKDDEEPIRTYTKTVDFGCAAKTVALVGAAACVLLCAAKLFDNKD